MRKAPQHAAGLNSLTVNKPDPKVLQDFLALKFSLSRRTAKAMIDGRSVWVNRKCVWIARFALRTGDLVEIPSQVVKGARKQSGGEDARRETKDVRHVRVLWSNESYLVCDKPAGLVSCDDPKSVETILREQEKIPTLEAVHRLDRDTTGCLMFAKNHAAFLAAVEVFKTHKVSKVYHAVATGSFKYAHQVIDSPIDGQPAVSKVTREGVRTHRFCASALRRAAPTRFASTLRPSVRRLSATACSVSRARVIRASCGCRGRCCTPPR